MIQLLSLLIEFNQFRTFPRTRRSGVMPTKSWEWAAQFKLQLSIHMASSEFKDRWRTCGDDNIQDLI